LRSSFKASILSKLDIPDGRLLLAFSGGSDSLALLYILSILAPDRTEAVYINHNIRSREELRAEIELNKRNAEALGIPLTVIAIDEGEVERKAKEDKCGTEAAARALRYEALEGYRAANSFDFILTAHHREDQLESFIMRVLENAPIYSLSGISKSEGFIYRPMLSLKKSEILEILSSTGLSWSEDSTNSDDEYKRNNIRHNIAPCISERERELIASICSNIFAFRNKESRKIDASFSYYVSFDRKSFLDAPPWMRDDIIFRANSYFDNKERVSRAFIAEIYEKAKAGNGRILSKNMSIYFSKDSIKLFPSHWDFAFPFSSLKAGPFSIKRGPIDDKTLIIDLSRVSSNAVLRTSRELDEIELKEGKKKVSELLKEYKIPDCVVLEDESGIIALFGRCYGAKDRLSRRYLNGAGTPISLEYEK